MAALNRSDYHRFAPGLTTEEIADTSEAGMLHMVERLDRMRSVERELFVTGHWAFNQPRHNAIVAALKAERAALRSITVTHCRQAAYDAIGPTDDETLAVVDRAVDAVVEVLQRAAP